MELKAKGFKARYLNEYLVKGEVGERVSVVCQDSGVSSIVGGLKLRA
jgi:hypothetical protein